MAQFNRKNILTMDFSYHGEPFVFLSSNPSDDLSGMDFSYQGEPFVSNWLPGSKIKQIHTSPYNTIGKIHGTGKSKIKKLGPTTTT